MQGGFGDAFQKPQQTQQKKQNKATNNFQQPTQQTVSAGGAPPKRAGFGSAFGAAQQTPAAAPAQQQQPHFPSQPTMRSTGQLHQAVGPKQTLNTKNMSSKGKKQGGQGQPSTVQKTNSSDRQASANPSFGGGQGFPGMSIIPAQQPPVPAGAMQMGRQKSIPASLQQKPTVAPSNAGPKIAPPSGGFGSSFVKPQFSSFGMPQAAQQAQAQAFGQQKLQQIQSNTEKPPVQFGSGASSSQQQTQQTQQEAEPQTQADFYGKPKRGSFQQQPNIQTAKEVPHSRDKGQTPSGGDPAKQTVMDQMFSQQKQHFLQKPAFAKSGTMDNNHNSDETKEYTKPDRHPKLPVKKSICTHYLKGTCKFADTCQNSHDVPAGTQPPPPQPKTKMPCQFYMQGNCNFGASCKNSHDFEIPQTEEEVYALMEQFASGDYGAAPKTKKQPEPAPAPVEREKQSDQFKGTVLGMSLADQQAKQQKQGNIAQPSKPEQPQARPQTHSQDDDIIQDRKKQAPKQTLSLKPQPTTAPPQAFPAFQHMPQARPPTPFVKSDSLHLVDPQTADITRCFYSDLDSSQQQVTVESYISELKAIQISTESLEYKDKATCVGMCSVQEVQNRTEVEKGSLSNFEQSRYRPSNELAIKKFQRSAADKVLNLASEIRPPNVIYHVVRYMRDVIVDQDRYLPNESYFKYTMPDQSRHTFFDIYTFVHDRIRQITQDLLIVNESATSVHNVRATEEMCRFLIISYHDAFFFKASGFDQVQNTERLTHNLSRLLESYKQARIQLSRGEIKQEVYDDLILNRAEFTAYYFIATSTSIDGVQEMLYTKQDTPYASQEWHMVTEALKLRLVIESSDCASFFRKLRSPSLNYFFACLMVIFMKHKYNDAITQLRLCYKTSISPDVLTSKLGITEEDSFTLITACGFDPQALMTPRVQNWNNTFGKWMQKGRLVFLDEKRGDRTRAILMECGDVGQEEVKAQIQLQRQVSLERAYKAKEIQVLKDKQDQLKRIEKEKEARRLEAMAQVKRQEEAAEEEKKAKAKAEQERVAAELKQKRKQELQGQIKDVQAKVDLQKRDIKSVQKGQDTLLKTLLNMNTFKQKLHHSKHQRTVLQHFFALWRRNTLTSPDDVQMQSCGPQFVKSAIIEALKSQPLSKIINYDLQEEDNDFGYVEPFSIYQQVVKDLASNTALRVQLISRPLKASTALKRLQYNQCIDGLIRLLTDSQQSLYTRRDLQATAQVQSQAQKLEETLSITYSIEQPHHKQYHFQFLACKTTNPQDTKTRVGTIITVVHSKKDLKWLQKMQQTVPQWCQILVILVGTFKSQFPPNVQVVSIPESLFSLRGSTFTKLLEQEISPQITALLKSSPVLELSPPSHPAQVSLRSLLQTHFNDYLELCKYAANQVSCAQFEKEMIQFFNNKQGYQLRGDLDDSQVYSVWMKILNSELSKVGQWLKHRLQQDYLSGQTSLFGGVPEMLKTSLAVDQQKFISNLMPYSEYILVKSLCERANQPEGAWYRGTLHFGIALHKMIEEADSVGCLYPETSVSQIDWLYLVSQMQESESYVAPVQVTTSVAPKGNSKPVLRSMQRAVTDMEKPLKRQKLYHGKSAVTQTLVDKKSLRRQEITKEVTELNRYLNDQASSNKERSGGKAATAVNDDGDEDATGTGDKDYAEIILKMLHSKKKRSAK